jgi:hypothetical protein
LYEKASQASRRNDLFLNKQRKEDMKSVSLLAVALLTALSVGAQTNGENPVASPATTGKPSTEENAKPNVAREQPAQAPGHEQVRTTEHGKMKRSESAHEQAGVSTRGHADARVAAEPNGKVTQSTTVFRHGRQTNEHLSVHRSVRERTDAHFNIGFHPRTWWLQTYTITLLDGCYYYLADDGCWYPAYGFEPGCSFPVGVVYCE